MIWKGFVINFIILTGCENIQTGIQTICNDVQQSKCWSKICKKYNMERRHGPELYEKGLSRCRKKFHKYETLVLNATFITMALFPDPNLDYKRKYHSSQQKFRSKIFTNSRSMLFSGMRP